MDNNNDIMDNNALAALKNGKYEDCINACLACIVACNYCASSCLKEPNVGMMAQCIQLDMECAALCTASVQLMSLDSLQVIPICILCADMCDAWQPNVQNMLMIIVALVQTYAGNVLRLAGK